MASADAYEAFCEPCTIRGKWTGVQGYCQVCNEYMCVHCLDVHQSQKMTKDHQILNKNEMPIGLVKNLDPCVMVCPDHSPEIIRFYCKAHEKPGCQDCMTLDHASCLKSRLKDVSNDYKGTQEFKRIYEKLEKFHKEIEVLNDVLNDNLKNLDATYSTIQQRITNYRKQVNDYLDEIESYIKHESAKIKKSQENEINQLMAENDSVKSELESVMERIKKEKNMGSVFVLTKQANQRLMMMEKEIANLELSRQQQHSVFYHSTDIDTMVSSTSHLGKLIRKTMINTAMKGRQMSRKMTALHTGHMSVDAPNDKKKCWVPDSAILTPDRIVVTDKTNYKIKLIDVSNKKVISRYTTTRQPYSVAAIGSDGAAVTLPHEGLIQVFNIVPTFTKTSEISVRQGCRGIAYSDGKLAVSYVFPGLVDILDMHGTILYSIQPKHSRRQTHILKQPNNIIFGQGNDTIIVSDHYTSKVYELTFTGQILRKYKHKALITPTGIAMSAEGYLFICSWYNGCIHIVSPDFKTCDIMLENNEYVMRPNSIAYCDINHRLYIGNMHVAEHMDNAVQVFDLNG